MPLDVVYSASALADLEAILAYVAIDSPQDARAWVSQIEQRCMLLSDFPELGVKRDDISPGLRMLAYRRAVIAYRLQTNRIRVVRVLYGGQDYAALVDH